MLTMLPAALTGLLLITGGVATAPPDGSVDPVGIVVTPQVEAGEPAAGAPRGEITGAADTVRFDVQVTNHTLSAQDLHVTPHVELGLGELQVRGECAWSQVAPGATKQCSIAYDVVQQDVDNGAVVVAFDATGDDGAKDATVSSIDVAQTAEVTVVTGAAAVPAEDEDVDAGTERVRFTLTVRSSGNVTVHGVAAQVVVDADVSENAVDASCGEDQLAPGAETECTATVDIAPVDGKPLTVTGIGVVVAEPPAGMEGQVDARSASAVIEVRAAPKEPPSPESSPAPAATAAAPAPDEPGSTPVAGGGTAAGTGGVAVRAPARFPTLMVSVTLGALLLMLTGAARPRPAARERRHRR